MIFPLSLGLGDVWLFISKCCLIWQLVAVKVTLKGSNPRCRSEVRKWEHGCYTLSHDTDTEIQDFALDTMMYIGCQKKWSFEYGGYTSYIAKGEDEELLSVCPPGNSLALVYRDKDTMRFVKHLNHRVTSLSPPRFYEINTVYYE